MIQTAHAKQLTIQTPEGVVFSLNAAGFFTRMMALLLDMSIISTLVIFLNTLFSLLALLNKDLATALLVLLYFVLSLGYFIFTEACWKGQTVGKRLFRLRVVDASGLRLQFSQVVIRNLLRPIDHLPLCYLLGGLIAFFSRHGQRLGDIAANTLVVVLPQAKQMQTQELKESKYNSFREKPHLESRLRQRLKPAEIALAVETVLRRDEMEAEDRVEIFHQLATHFRSLLKFEEETLESLMDEQFVRNIVASALRQV